MADVEVQMQYTTTERKVRKVKKTSKRRESSDANEVTISELDGQNQQQAIEGYVLEAGGYTDS